MATGSSGQVLQLLAWHLLCTVRLFHVSISTPTHKKEFIFSINLVLLAKVSINLYQIICAYPLFLGVSGSGWCLEVLFWRSAVQYLCPFVWIMMFGRMAINGKSSLPVDLHEMPVSSFLFSCVFFRIS